MATLEPDHRDGPHPTSRGGPFAASSTWGPSSLATRDPAALPGWPR
jgi:hypothetical protein